MRRVSAVLVTALLSLTVLAGCGLADAGGRGWTEVAPGLSPEQATLRALGYQVGEGAGEDAAGKPAEPGRADRWQRRRHRAVTRVLLRRNALHGEAAVQTPDGTVTVLFQRGEVAGLTGTSVTVQSDDGFTEAWQLGGAVRVIELRQSVDSRELQVGDPIAVAGVRPDDEPVARLIVIDGR